MSIVGSALTKGSTLSVSWAFCNETKLRNGWFDDAQPWSQSAKAHATTNLLSLFYTHIQHVSLYEDTGSEEVNVKPIVDPSEQKY